MHFSFSRCDSIEKLKAQLPKMEQELKDQGKFKDFYQFTFNFAKNPGQKGLGTCPFVSATLEQEVGHKNFSFSNLSDFFFVLDLEMAIAYWNLVLAGRFKFLELWNKFLVVSPCLIDLNSIHCCQDFISYAVKVLEGYTQNSLTNDLNSFFLLLYCLRRSVIELYFKNM